MLEIAKPTVPSFRLFLCPRDSFLALFSHFTTARQNWLKNFDFRTSVEIRGCFAVCFDSETSGLSIVKCEHKKYL